MTTWTAAADLKTGAKGSEYTSLQPYRNFRLGLEGMCGTALDQWFGRATIERRGSDEAVPCVLRYLRTGELGQLLDLQDRIHEHLADKDLFRKVSPEKHTLYVRPRGRSAGAFVDRVLARAIPVPPDCVTSNRKATGGPQRGRTRPTKSRSWRR